MQCVTHASRCMHVISSDGLSLRGQSRSSNAGGLYLGRASPAHDLVHDCRLAMFIRQIYLWSNEC